MIIIKIMKSDSKVASSETNSVHVISGQSYSDCFTRDFWSKLSAKINCSLVYFDAYIPAEEKSKIRGIEKNQ